MNRCTYCSQIVGYRLANLQYQNGRGDAPVCYQCLALGRGSAWAEVTIPPDEVDGPPCPLCSKTTKSIHERQRLINFYCERCRVFTGL